jgi:hypothetical protein
MPAIQLQLIAVCFFFAACSGMLQAILVQRFVADLYLQFPAQFGTSLFEASREGIQQFFVSLAFMFPFVLGLGTLVTFRYAGPLVHFEKHLRRIAAGEDPGECRLRKGDQLNNIAEAINLAVAALRARSANGSELAREVAPPPTIEQPTT